MATLAPCLVALALTGVCLKVFKVLTVDAFFAGCTLSRFISFTGAAALTFFALGSTSIVVGISGAGLLRPPLLGFSGLGEATFLAATGETGFLPLRVARSFSGVFFAVFGSSAKGVITKTGSLMGTVFLLPFAGLTVFLVILTGDAEADLSLGDLSVTGFTVILADFLTSGVGNNAATPDGLAGSVFLLDFGVAINLFIPVGLEDLTLLFFGLMVSALLRLKSAFPPSPTLFLPFFPDDANFIPEDLADDKGDTIISPGPIGVSGRSAYSTESGVPAVIGVVGDKAGGVVNRSATPPRLTLPCDRLWVFCKIKILKELILSKQLTTWAQLFKALLA